MAILLGSFLVAVHVDFYLNPALTCFETQTGIVIDSLVTMAPELLPSLPTEALSDPKAYLLLRMFLFMQFIVPAMKVPIMAVLSLFASFSSS